MKPTAEVQRVAAAVPARMQGTSPADYSALTLDDMKRIGRCRTIDELNIRAYFIRRGLGKQAARLGAIWNTKKGRFAPKG